jgi:hypothetical protein
VSRIRSHDHRARLRSDNGPPRPPRATTVKGARRWTTTPTTSTTSQCRTPGTAPARGGSPAEAAVGSAPAADPAGHPPALRPDPSAPTEQPAHRPGARRRTTENGDSPSRAGRRRPSRTRCGGSGVAAGSRAGDAAATSPATLPGPPSTGSSGVWRSSASRPHRCRSKAGATIRCRSEAGTCIGSSERGPLGWMVRLWMVDWCDCGWCAIGDRSGTSSPHRMIDPPRLSGMMVAWLMTSSAAAPAATPSWPASRSAWRAGPRSAQPERLGRQVQGRRSTPN